MKNNLVKALLIVMCVSGVVFVISIMFYDTKVGNITGIISLSVFVVMILVVMGIITYESK